MLKQSLAIMKREILYMWHDQSLRNILLLGPLLGLLLFLGVYSAQRVGDISTAIVDLDRSSASQELITALENANDLKIVTYPEHSDEVEELIKRGKVTVGVVIPEDYGEKVALHRQTQVAVWIDGTNMAYATNASTAILTVTRTLGAQAGVKTLIAQGIQPLQAQEAYQGIEFREQAWFNPTLNYAYFLILGFVLNIWQQCATLASCMNIIGEKGAASWKQIQASGVSLFQLFFLKSLVQIGVCVLISLPIYYFAFEVFQLPHAAGWPSFLVFTLAFTIALHSLGTFMSSIATNAVNASRYGMVVALPSFIISGFTWPLEAMPQCFQPLAWLLPQTWFFQGISYLSFKNPGWEFLSHYLTTFALMAVIFYSLAALFTKGIPFSRFFRSLGNTPDKGTVPLSRLAKRGDSYEADSKHCSL